MSALLSTTMLKKALDTHNASQSKQSLKSQLFPSSSPDAPRDVFAPFKPPTMTKKRPLSTTSGNIGKPSSTGNSHTIHSGQKPLLVASKGLKRTSSGLAKALDANFDDFDLSLVNSQTNPIVVEDEVQVQEKRATVYFDENDFDSDIDLDVEDPMTKGTVEYSKSPSVRTQEFKSESNPPVYGPSALSDDAASKRSLSERTNSTDSAYFSAAPVSTTHNAGLNFKPTRPAAQSHSVRHWEQPAENQYVSQLGRFRPPKLAQASNESVHPPSSSADPLPWSSSPIEHTMSIAAAQRAEKSKQIREFAFFKPRSNEEEPPPPLKRRKLPWAEASVETDSQNPPEETKPSFNVPNDSRTVTASVATSTPLSKSTEKSMFPWNTTASAVKEQQRALKQASKKLVKANEATDESYKEAVAKKRQSTISRIFLSEEQQHVLNLVVEQKKSVFFTGSAGTGKSVLLREIIASLRRKFQREPDRVAVTASTGLAACNIGGVTLHSFSGIGLGKESPEELVKKIKKNQKARQRWLRTKVLIVDEISMVDGELFDKLETVARILRNNGRPFGGIQLVITGDFFQLPPVPDSGRAARFAFDAGTWNTAIEHTIALHHVFRQKDPTFANMLNEMREGRLTSQSIQTFRTLERPLHFDDTMEATELFPTRQEVDFANNLRMQQLRGEVRIYEAKDGGSITDLNLRKKLLSNCMAPETIALKKGCQVMLIKNMDETLVNGSLGRVIGFMSESTFEYYQEHEEEFYQLNAATDEDLNPVQKKMKARIDDIASTVQAFPVVRFVIADGTTRDMLCHRETWKVELPNGEVQASRAQVPLILAWALSIHKAQGQTLERVKVDLGKVFEKGQAYVALSRATCMEGLQVLRFDPKKVVAHERVRNFYKGLQRAEHAAAESKGTGLGGQKKKGRVQKELWADGYERTFLESAEAS